MRTVLIDIEEDEGYKEIDIIEIRKLLKKAGYHVIRCDATTKNIKRNENS